MDKFFEIGLLLDIYGEMLTDKQRNVMSLRYLQDLSLGEISSITNTSRQAVNDIIKRSTHTLFEVEKKIGSLNRQMEIDGQLANVIEKMTALLGKQRESVSELQVIVEEIQSIKKNVGWQ